ncbi:hypothetical protein [Neolewinella agarilytica]|uniref:Uncharacterized protein n=1 Tax=Neolewinella agarilytica TaxID=478744 RepID=A0A1H9NMG8_9BACT|nr:hypothetical protein [Neolewinella agarilytica]SER37138.1 hypothetical protein SAMN05444359_13817 [Neolewinella agarilytica]
MPKYIPDETDIIFIRLLRRHIGAEWSVAKAAILKQLPEGIDPERLSKYVDDSDHPHIHINAYGVEPRFYAHRTSKRLLEFYPTK